MSNEFKTNGNSALTSSLAWGAGADCARTEKIATNARLFHILPGKEGSYILLYLI